MRVLNLPVMNMPVLKMRKGLRPCPPFGGSTPLPAPPRVLLLGKESNAMR